MRILGRHLIVEFCDCDRTVLNDQSLLEREMKEAVRRSGATIVESVFHRYNPCGVSGAVIIAESHFSIHSWPEYGYAAVDFFTCGGTVDPQKAADYMKDALKAGSCHTTQLSRGIPSDFDEIIDHKPTPVHSGLTRTSVHARGAGHDSEG